MSEVALLVLSGDDHYQRRRKREEFVRYADSQGWLVSRLVEPGLSTLRASMRPNPFMSGHALLLVSDPDRDCSDILQKHHGVTDPRITVLVTVSGKIGKRHGLYKLAKHIQNFHLRFELPAPYKMGEYVSEFFQKELSAHGISISISLASQAVLLMGEDTGVAAHEAYKLKHYKGGSGEVEVRDVVATYSAVGEASLTPLIDGVKFKNAARVSRSLAHILKTHKGDPVIRLVRVLFSQVEKWAAAIFLEAQHKSPARASEHLGVHAWYHEKQIQPAMAAWGRRGLLHLMRILSESERCVLQGSSDPWTFFTISLISACSTDFQS